MLERRMRDMATEPHHACGSFVLAANGLGRGDASRRDELG
jgi:hypothetical protein